MEYVQERAAGDGHGCRDSILFLTSGSSLLLQSCRNVLTQIRLFGPGIVSYCSVRPAGKVGIFLFILLPAGNKQSREGLLDK